MIVFRYLRITHPPAGAEAARILAERIEARTGLRAEFCSPEDAAIRFVRDTALPEEGFDIAVEERGMRLRFADRRGAIYAAGWLLRKAECFPGGFGVPEGMRLSCAPASRLRGMQLGYRALSNANDTWTKAQYIRYIEDLALFGANAVEILPDDEPGDSAFLQKYPVDEMNAHIAEVCERLGLDVWYWLPHHGDFMGSYAARTAMMEWVDERFAALPRLDAVFLPGSDPGDLETDDLFAFAERVAACARRRHPGARMWISPQVTRFTPEALERFYARLDAVPSWLDGVVFGPWERDGAEALRRRVPAAFPIRNYPDLSHSFHCQYPVPFWDPAFAMTHGRECINPRPTDMKRIHNRFAGCFVGSIGYSDGITDDINKFVWLDQEFDPDIDVADTLRDYAHVFLGSGCEERFARGVMLLEENLKAPVAANRRIGAALREFEAMNRLPGLAGNFRFRLCLLRARYDAYIQRRLVFETGLEARARRILEDAGPRGIRRAIVRARGVLATAERNPPARALRRRCEATAEQLYRQVGLQSSVGRYHAARWLRAAFMDGLDKPLCDRLWLISQMDASLRFENDEAAWNAVWAALHRTDAPPGGFYIKLGGPGSFACVRTPCDPAADPGAVGSAFLDYSVDAIGRFYQPDGRGVPPLAQISGAATLFDIPLTLEFTGLARDADYTLRVVYCFNKRPPRIGMRAGDIEIQRPAVFAMGDGDHTYHIPRSAIKRGVLRLEWTATEGNVGPCVSELWLSPCRAN